MKPGMPLLLTVLRGQPCIPATEQQWQETLHLAAAESVLPWLTHLLLTSSAPVPPAIAEALHRSRREARINAFLYTSELTGLLQAFAAAKIPVLLLKGPSLAERLYGSAALRPTRDLDLLVRRRHFNLAQHLLRTLGFTPNSLPDDYHQSLTRNTITVELHYEVENPLAFNFHLDSAWQEAQPASFHGQPAYLFAPADELVYLALHAVRHRYSRLSYVLDLALALRHFGSISLVRAQVQPLENLLTLAIYMAHRLLPEFLPPKPDPYTQRLGDRLWLHLLTQMETEMDWQTLHRFYVELEPTRLRRIARHFRHLRILATRLTQPDREFAARLGFAHPWAAHVLRPLRLVLNRRGTS